MSTRYVWDVYDLAKEPAESESSVSVENIAWNNSEDYIALPIISYTFENGEYKPTSVGSPLTYDQLLSGVSAITYPYLAIASFSGTNYPASFKKIYKAVPTGDYKQRWVWYCRRDSSVSPSAQAQTGRLTTTDSNYIEQGRITDSNFTEYANTFKTMTVKYVAIDEKGETKIGIVSSASSTAYPQDGRSGPNWYSYKGSDSIDPIGVSYSTDTPERGQVVKALVEPAAETNLAWNQAPLPENLRYGPAVYGNGKYIMFGWDPSGFGEERKLFQSTDGISWSLAGTYNYSDVPLNNLIYAGGKFVGVDSSYVYYSANGADWLKTELPLAETGAYWSAIAYGGGAFCIVASKGTQCAVSSDGTSWDVRNNVPSSGSGLGWDTITYGNEKFLCSSYSSDLIVYSEDHGVTWETHSFPIVPGTSAFSGKAVFGNGKFVFLANDGRIAVSEDCMNWTGPYPPLDGFGGSSLKNIAFSDGKFMISSYGAQKTYYGTDGVNWSAAALPSGSNFDNLSGCNDRFFATFTSGPSSSGQPQNDTLAYTVSGLGGVISYLYQYSINGGKNWLNAGAAITDLEKEITVPENAEQFMVRVRAQDDIGFISADYVTGANLEVQVMRLWVGVNNVARKSKKLWVGVDGVARQAVRAWVGDENGKARRWF